MKNIEIHAEITNKCILSCKHCSSIANTSVDEIEFNELIKFIEKVSNGYKIRLTLTGGEPLLRDNLEELLIEIQKLNKDIDVGLFTTGLIKDKDEIRSIEVNEIRKLKDLGVKFVFISVYSNNKESHDTITQSSLSFEKTMESIKRLVNVGIETNINLPLMKINVMNLKEIIDYLKELNVNEIRLLRLVNHGVAEKNWSDIGLTNQEQIDAIKNIENYFDEQISLGGFLEFMSCQYLGKDRRCLAGKNKFYIDNSGNVYPCGAVKLNASTKICNISDDIVIGNHYKLGYSCMAYK